MKKIAISGLNRKGAISINTVFTFLLLFVYMIMNKVNFGEYSFTEKIVQLVGSSITLIIILCLSYLSVKRYGDDKPPDAKLFVLSMSYIILVFAIIYSIIYKFDTSTNFIISNSYKNGLTFFDFLYYSVVTFTTLGYGDISPLSILAKTYTMLEVLIFVIYVSIVLLNFSNREEK